jgi:nucleoside-diphosphate-sugar epimerase
MKILVLGGTGYVGRRITERLLARGDEVAVVSRGNLQPGVLKRVEHIQVDLKDRDAFAAAFRDRRFDALMDNIAYDRADADSAIRAFRGRIGHYIFTSTMAVYDGSKMERPVRESDDVVTHMLTEAEVTNSALHPNPARALTYTNGKRQVELAFRESSEDFPFTALRAPIVVGPDDRTLRIWWFVQRIQDGGPLIYPDWGYGRVFQVVYADDLAQAFINALENPKAFNKAFNIAQPEILSPETWAEGLAGALGRTASLVRIPEGLIGPGGLSGYTMPIAGRPFGHFLMDLTNAYRDLGFQPTPWSDWIGDTAQGCAAAPPAKSSEGYERRDVEIAVARRFERLQQEMYDQFAAEVQER